MFARLRTRDLGCTTEKRGTLSLLSTNAAVHLHKEAIIAANYSRVRIRVAAVVLLEKFASAIKNSFIRVYAEIVIFPSKDGKSPPAVGSEVKSRFN